MAPGTAARPPSIRPCRYFIASPERNTDVGGTEPPSQSHVAAEENCDETICFFDHDPKLSIRGPLRNYASRLLSPPSSSLRASWLPDRFLLELLPRRLAGARYE